MHIHPEDEQPEGQSPPTLEKEVARRIDDGSIGPVQLRTLVLCILIGVLDGYDLANMALAVPLIARDWGVEPGTFGAALAAVMVGVAVGNIAFGWLGDRFGRRPTLIFSTFAIGLMSILTVTSTDVVFVTIWRFLLGLSFGAGFPNTYAMIADIVPARRRLFSMTILTGATSVGAIGSGLIAPALSSAFGWEGIFLAGGIVPLLIAVLMIFILPESPKVLAAHGRAVEAQKVLALFRLDSTNLPTAREALKATPLIQPVRLVRNGYFFVTACYVLGWICSGFTYYILANWLPTLLTNSGWDVAASQRSITFLYAGSMIGGLTISWIVDHWSKGLRVPAIVYAIGAVLFVVAAFSFGSPLLYPVIVGLGLTVGGAQYLLPALVARVYPADMIATALSWLGAISRLGSVLGPMAGGWMLLAGWGPHQIILISSLGPMISATAFGLMVIAARRTRMGATA